MFGGALSCRRTGRAQKFGHDGATGTEVSRAAAVEVTRRCSYVYSLSHSRCIEAAGCPVTLNDTIVRAWGRSAPTPPYPCQLPLIDVDLFTNQPTNQPQYAPCHYSSCFTPPSPAEVCIFRPLIILNIPTLGCTSWNPNRGYSC
jgi:hypothetical protein